MNCPKNQCRQGFSVGAADAPKNEWGARIASLGGCLRSLRWVLAPLCLLVPGTLGAGDFEERIEPIFESRCLDCHGPDKQKSQFRVDRLATLLKGGDSGEPAVVPGKPESSFLLKAIRHEAPNFEMPPKGEKLSEGEIARIEAWIRDGARTPDRLGPAEEKVELTHWSFVPLTKPERGDSIDDFIDATLEDNGLARSAEADRRTLIRRLFLVMLGLPPTPEQVDRFVRDDTEGAWGRLIDEALDSPHYGERWATHWLDLARFGESNGFETNRERPSAWPFRDWVIDSFNQDKPYDQFIREQIAGDVVGAPIGTGFLVAGPVDIVKGQDPLLGLVQRMNELDDMINTTGTAFLGLTTGCARCHNHKFDPISQVDYYAMQAVFAGVNHGETEVPLTEDARQELAALRAEIAELKSNLVAFIPKTQSESSGGGVSLRPPVNAKHNIERFEPRPAKFVRFTTLQTNGGQPCLDELEIFSGDQNVALASVGAVASSGGDFVHPLHQLKHINDGRYGNARSWIAKESTGWVQIEISAVTEIDRIEWARDREGEYRDRVATDYRIEAAVEPGEWELLASSADRAAPSATQSETEMYRFEGERAEQGRAWHARLQQLEADIEEIEASQNVYAGQFSQPGATHRLYRGEPDAKREEVGPDAIAVFASLNLENDAPEKDRRLALADWIASPENPLTARVIVNRLWQFHFGTGIVDTPSDFGRNGAKPTHPELLDWLAMELIESGWSLKHIHRLILQSATWKQSSRPRESAARVDAGTRWLWRFPPRRLAAEGIRDSILSVTGALDLENRGGPGFSPFKVELENVRHYHPKENFGPDDWRRMVYMTKIRQEREQVFGVFDCPDASQAVPKRSRSTTPLQALNLLNSRFVMQQAELFAKRLADESQDREAQIQRAYKLCFSRPARRQEIVDAAAFIDAQGLIQFTRALLNANEFVFIP